MLSPATASSSWLFFETIIHRDACSNRIGKYIKMIKIPPHSLLIVAIVSNEKKKEHRCAISYMYKRNLKIKLKFCDFVNGVTLGITFNLSCVIKDDNYRERDNLSKRSFSYICLPPLTLIKHNKLHNDNEIVELTYKFRHAKHKFMHLVSIFFCLLLLHIEIQSHNTKVHSLTFQLLINLRSRWASCQTIMHGIVVSTYIQERWFQPINGYR